MEKITVDKDFLLKESKTFCMFPWMHLYASPRGDVYPCCTTTQCENLGNAKQNSLKEIFNSDKTNQLRLDMLNGVPSDLCKGCYNTEESSPDSYRNYSKVFFSKYFDEIVTQTNHDGSVDDFKMRMIDIRFSNICNFKCRTCGSDCSSQFAAEEKELGRHDFVVLHVDDKKGTVLEEVIEHLDHTEMVYFAGGEPLVTDEHYVLLEELIKRGRTDVKLRYNTNASNIEFKNRNLIELWNHFKSIEVACSIDHYGERAELIRHGTDWATVENNLMQFRKMEQVLFSVSTVLSIFNYPTLNEFYEYLIEKNIIYPTDTNHYISLATNPGYFASTALPKHIKERYHSPLEQFCDNRKEYDVIAKQVRYAINFTNSVDTWEENRYDFLKYNWMRDKLRGEDFLRVFPELAAIVYE